MVRQRFTMIEGLRALAATLVVIVHCWLSVGFNDLPTWVNRVGVTPVQVFAQWMNNVGGIGVALFYVISGFLLYRPFVAARLSGGTVATGAYAIRRAARIIPAYWAALTIVALVESANIFNLHGLINYYLFGEIYTYRALTDPHPIFVSWTLCVEVSFYVFLPFWAAGIRWLGDRLSRPQGLEGAGIALLFLISAIWKIVAVQTTNYGTPLQPLLVVLPATIDVFAAGMALAVLSVRAAESPGFAAARWLAQRPWLCLGASLLMYLSFAWVSGTPDNGVYSWELTALMLGWLRIPICAALVLPVVLGAADRWPTKVLNWRTAAWIGSVSYGLYLWHVPVIEHVMDLLGHPKPPLLGMPLIFLLIYAVALVIAAVSWNILEKPVLNAAHRLAPSSRSKAKA